MRLVTSQFLKRPQRRVANALCDEQRSGKCPAMPIVCEEHLILMRTTRRGQC